MKSIARSVLAAAAAMVVSAALAPAFADHDDRDRRSGNTDFALYDGTNPANTEAGALCFAERLRVGDPWDLHVAASSFGGTGFQVRYKDGDFVNYQVPTGTSFSLSEAAGRNRSNVAIRIIDQGGTSPAGTSGSVSAEGLYGTRVKCISCDEDSDGPAACDRIIPYP
jgi:hypothetical protein